MLQKVNVDITLRYLQENYKKSHEKYRHVAVHKYHTAPSYSIMLYDKKTGHHREVFTTHTAQKSLQSICSFRQHKKGQPDKQLFLTAHTIDEPFSILLLYYVSTVLSIVPVFYYYYYFWATQSFNSHARQAQTQHVPQRTLLFI